MRETNKPMLPTVVALGSDSNHDPCPRSAVLVPVRLPAILDQFVANPQKLTHLSAQMIAAVLIEVHGRLANYTAFEGLLLGRLLAMSTATDNAPMENGLVVSQKPYLNGEEGAAYICIRKSRLDHLRREGCVQATRDGK